MTPGPPGGPPWDLFGTSLLLTRSVVEPTDILARESPLREKNEKAWSPNSNKGQAAIGPRHSHTMIHASMQASAEQQLLVPEHLDEQLLPSELSCEDPFGWLACIGRHAKQGVEG